MSQGLGIFGGGGGGGSSISATEPAQISELEEKTAPVAGDVYIIEDSQDGYAKKKVTQSNSSASVWSRVINESGSSFSIFTSGGGTWSSDGTVIKQTNTGVSAGFAYTGKHPIVVSIFEAEVMMKTNGGRGGIGIGAASGSLSAIVYIQPSADNIVAERAGQAALVTTSTTINVDTWYKIRLFVSGGTGTFYLDNTLIDTTDNHKNLAAVSGFALYAHQAEVWFRNVKAWVLPLPV